MLSLDEVEDELTVSLRAGETRVYDPERLSTAREQGLCDLVDDAPVDVWVATTPFGTSARPASNCGFTSTSARQPGAASASAGGSASLHRDERHVARDELRRERQLGERARVHALENRDARVVADLRVELPVADVERDHPRRAALEQHVGEPAGRGADVERIETGDVDPERVERVGELVPAAGDVRRRRLDLERRRRRRPARRASSAPARARP